MSCFEKFINVEVPLAVAYDRWAQFEQFPLFMEGVDEVQRITDTLLYWYTEMDGIKRGWAVKILEQVPDRRIVWRSTLGAQHQVSVSFHYIDENLTLIRLEMDYEPKSFAKRFGSASGLVEERMSDDLWNFKALVENHYAEIVTTSEAILQL